MRYLATTFPIYICVVYGKRGGTHRALSRVFVLGPLVSHTKKCRANLRERSQVLPDVSDNNRSEEARLTANLSQDLRHKHRKEQAPF
ncbi:hypothetical protein JOB18_035756 [Solea senegalensis]|uniref:Secreted protein n=1 Tax=Solea senegalensis TaxID=28829 RepID=A0AAV6QWF5_SOLSE|nr:hypothetical protein JOB18_035756 [Solea senegalensis]